MCKADIVLKSNAVFTGLEKAPIQGGIAIIGNKIAAVGERDELIKWTGPDTQVLEFEDELIMPGFIDAHMHFFTGAFVNSPYMLMAPFESHSEEQCVKMVKEFAEEHPEYPKITGMGWFPAWWNEGSELPNRHSLDAVVADKPVYLLAADGHTFWLNSKALEECGITKETEVSFGKIGKDQNGELNGLLFEIEAEALANQYGFELPVEQMKDVQRNFYREVAKYGITSTTNMSVNPVTESVFTEYEVAGELEKEGELTVRLHLYPSLGLDTNYDVVKKLRKQFCSEKLQISGLKQFVDGVTSTYSAYLLEPYADKPETVGFSNYSPEHYKKCVCGANAEGFSVRLHAIGDAAVRLALDIFEESNRQNGNNDLKNTIEHIESIHADDLERFAELKVIPSVQPIHLEMDANEKIDRIGEERCQLEWPFRSLLKSGATLAFGTDFPVAPINPFPNIYTAVTRCDGEGAPTGVNPQEKISVAEALRAYTLGSACAINREKELGTLEAGKLADVVVLNKNIFDISSREILDAAVKLTIMDGNIVYSA